MKLQFFSSRFLVRLREKASMNASKYGADSGWLDALAAGQAYVHESGYVVDPPPTLVIATEGNAQLDAENARRVYSWLRNLTPSVAMEERLWAHLTHCVFAEYMAIRWPAKNEGVVCRRYLFEGNSFAALARNGIARLWWAGNLTPAALNFGRSERNPFAGRLQRSGSRPASERWSSHKSFLNAAGISPVSLPERGFPPPAHAAHTASSPLRTRRPSGGPQ